MSQENSGTEGFDLDALPEGNGDVIYELGGKASVVAVPPPAAPTDERPPTTKSADPPRATDTADDFKAKGNAAFKEKNWLEAMDMYTAAIESLPGLTADELLKLREEHEKEAHAHARKRLAEQDERRRRKREAEQKKRNQGKKQDDLPTDDAADQEEESPPDEEDAPMPPFRAPPHVHAERLAVLHANRAAAFLHLEEYEAAIRDCDVAILWKPTYTKAYLRRATLHEKYLVDGVDNNTEAALADAKMAQQLDPGNPQIRALVRRLQKLEDERLEKLKAETMDKLKDLGNSILGNFGLSLDNFNAVQDPKTGSYSISFNQNGGSG